MDELGPTHPGDLFNDHGQCRIGKIVVVARVVETGRLGVLLVSREMLTQTEEHSLVRDADIAVGHLPETVATPKLGRVVQEVLHEERFVVSVLAC